MKETSVQKNTIFNAIKSASSIIFPLITFPYASRVLQTEAIGKVNFGNSVVNYVSLLATLGITTYAVRECAKVRDDKQQLGNVASQMFSINVFTTLVAYIILGLTLMFAKPLENYRLLIVVQSTVVLFTTLGTDWLNTAMEDFRFITLRTIFFQVVSLILMFLFVKGPEDYLLYAAITVVSSGGANLTNIFYRRKFCRVHITVRIDLKRHMGPILLLFSMILSQTIYVNSDVTIIGLFRGDHEVGLYSTAVKVYTIVNTMVASVAFVVMPKLTYWFAKKDYGQINLLLRYGLGFIVTLGFPCIVGINAVCKDIIMLLAGAEYLEAVPALHILTIALLGSFFGGFVGNLIMIPSGREKICLRTSLISALTNMVLNLIFIPIFGFVAAAATTAVAEFISFFIGLHYVEKQIKIGDLKKLLFAPLLGCVAMVVVVLLVSAFIKALAVRLVLSIALGAGVYLAVLVLMKHEFTLSMLRRNSKP